MDYQVNTDEVRRVAREVRRIADEVKSLSAQNVRSMTASVKESLEGETAVALTDILSDLSSDITKIGSGLDAVQRALTDYAARVEEADRKIQQMIQDN